MNHDGATGAAPAARAASAASSIASRDLVALLVDSVSDYAIFALDADGVVTTWNPGAQRLKGYTADEIIGQHFSRFYPEEDRIAKKPEMELAIAVADSHFEDEGWRVRNDGTMFWASVTIAALRGADGRLVGFGKVTRDLTERKRGEELLRDSEERFRLLVSSVSDYAIFLLDPEGIVTSWNLGAERLKGYRADEILGRHFSTFYTSEDLRRGVPATALARAIETGHFENQGWRVRKDGSRFWADVVITSLHGADGGHRGFAKVTRDLTDRKRSEDALRGVLAREREAAAKLREIDQMRSEVVGIIAHDLRAPLGVIQGVVHLLREEWGELDDAQKLDHIERINARSLSMSALVDDVFEIARLEAGQLEIDRLPFAVSPVVERAISDVIAIPKTRIVSTELQPDARAVGDEGKTWQVVANLLSNALKFSASDSPVHVAVRRHDSEIHITVRDSGRGISIDEQQVMFQRFRRLADEHGTSGSGLGLFIAKALVEAQHGRISVQSSPGAGSTFRVVLPAEP